MSVGGCLARPVGRGGGGGVRGGSLEPPFWPPKDFIDTAIVHFKYPTGPLVSLLLRITAVQARLVDLIRSQETNQTWIDPETTSGIKKSIRRLNRLRHIQQADSVQNHLTLGLKRSVELAKEKGASSWLSVLPLEEHGFYLHKGEFRDAVCLRYGWQLNNIPRTCKCGTQFTVDHAMTCHLGGFPTIRCYRKFDRSEILSRRSYFLGNFIAERYFFLGNIIAARKFDRSRCHGSERLL